MRKLLGIGAVLLTFFFGQAIDSAWTAAQLALTPNPRDANYAFGESKLFSIYYSDKYGYIDQTGKTVISPQFDMVEDFHEGVAKVRVGRKEFFIDRFGNKVIATRFYPQR